jgi:copper chaperone CopZ
MSSFGSEPQRGTAGWWGVIAGVAGSFCCLGPSAAVLLGLGSSSALFSLQFDQPWALLLSTVLLLAGAIHSYRKQRGLCGIGRWRAPLMLLASFGIAYGLLAGALPLLASRIENSRRVQPAAVAAVQPQAAALPSPKTELRRLTLIVEKMTCPPCAVKIRNRLHSKPAVRQLRAEEYNEEVVITYDPAQASAEELTKLIPREYGVLRISDEPLR